MAKVYDALKRVEQERQRSERAPAARIAVVECEPDTEPAPEPPPLQGRKWWPTPWVRRESSRERSAPPEGAVLERVEEILSRLHFLEKSTSEKIPDMERVLHVMEARLHAFEKEHRERVADVSDDLTRRVAQVSKRVSILLGIVGLILLLVLFR